MHVLVRNLDRRTVERLRTRALGNARSLQAELKATLEEAAANDLGRFRAAAERLRRRLHGRSHSDSGRLQAEDRLR